MASFPLQKEQNLDYQFRLPLFSPWTRQCKATASLTRQLEGRLCITRFPQSPNTPLPGTTALHKNKQSKLTDARLKTELNLATLHEEHQDAETARGKSAHCCSTEPELGPSLGIWPQP